MSKPKITSILDKKIMTADSESKALEKTFYKGGMNQKNFIDSFLEKRREFHKYQIMKVKVN